MSEEDIKINGVVQVVKFLIFGLIFMSILYIIVSSGKGQFLDNATFVAITDSLKSGLLKYGDNAKIILIGIIVFLSIITGMLINDLAKKFSIVSLFLFVVITAVDFAPIILFIERQV